MEDSSLKSQETKRRRIKSPEYKSFRISKKIKSPQPKLPSTWFLLKNSKNIMRKNWKFFGGLTLIYLIFAFVLVKSSTASTDIVGLKDSVQNLLGQDGGIFSNLVLYGALWGSNTAGSEVGGLYQLILVLVISLALIFGLRNIFTDGAQKPKIKQSLYEGMAPLIPVILVLLVIGLQLIPLSIGTSLYATVVNGGIAVTGVEKAFWLVTLLLLALLSLYMVASSIFALYIATLPGMTPMKALRGARNLVLHRRWVIMRKLIALPIFLLVFFGLVIVPLIAFIPAIAELVFFVLSATILPFAHTYIYSLYRKML